MLTHATNASSCADDRPVTGPSARKSYVEKWRDAITVSSTAEARLAQPGSVTRRRVDGGRIRTKVQKYAAGAKH
ncbi:unnamed protein product, partial [Iphiclides podalirius]